MTNSVFECKGMKMRNEVFRERDKNHIDLAVEQRKTFSSMFYETRGQREVTV